MKTPSKEPLIGHDSPETWKPIIAKISAILLATGIAVGVLVYGGKVGFNNSPRAPHEKGIKLTDKKANKRIMCLRELFHDLIRKPLFKNKWRAKNCPPNEMAKLSKPPNQLRNIVETRKDIFREQGIDPVTEIWLRDKGFMKIKVDDVSKSVGINAGKIEE